MDWSDFEIPQSFIVKNSKQRINFDTGCVTNVTFYQVGSIFVTFKVLENSPNELRNTCGLKYAIMRIC